MWFRMIPLPGGTRCYIGFWGAYNAPLYASEVASCFFATNMPNPLLWAQNYVSGWFRAIPLPGGTSCEIGFWGAYNAPLYASEVASCFSERTCPIHLFRPKTMFLGGFTRFRCREVQVVRSGFGVHKMHHFVLPKLRLVLSQRTCPIHFFRPKTKFLGGFARFRCQEVPIVRSG